MEQNVQRILQMFGGLALFLYAMEEMSAPLQHAAETRLRTSLQQLTKHPVSGLLAGALVTAVLQSSSVTTVVVVGLVSAGLLDLRQALPVIFGANIGTTITAQLLAFRLEDARYGILFAGLLAGFFWKDGAAHQTGRAVFAFGLLLEGIAVMDAAAAPLAQSPVFRHWMLQVRQKPLLGAAVGTGMTLLVQSSSATIAVLQDLASQPGPDGASLLGLAGALPILLGDNIGTTITAVLASLGQSRDAKRTALAHCIFNLSGAVVFGLGLPWFIRVVQAVSPQGAERVVIARQIANAHTLFNGVCALCWLPLTGCLADAVNHLLPEHRE